MAGVNGVGAWVGLAEMYLGGMSLPEIAEQAGIAISTVRYRIIASGVSMRGRGEAVRMVRHKLGGGLRGKRRTFTTEHCRNISLARRRHSERFAAGISLKPSGYLEHTKGEHKGRGQHVTVAEAKIGRGIRPGEVVHHIDGDRQNNDPENLQVMTRSEHARLHAIERSSKRKRESNGCFC